MLACLCSGPVRRREAVKRPCPEAKVEHEVKLLLRPDVALTSTGALAPAFVRAFAVHGDASHVSMQFVDTPDKDLNTSGWNVRLRRTRGQRNGEVTFKRRFKVDDDSVDEAWDEARASGITDTGRYRQQLEWNRERRTLSFSIDKAFDVAIGSGSRLPAWDASLRVATSLFPGRLRRLQITAQPAPAAIAASAGIFGPVHGVRWEGTWNRTTPIRIESWDIRGSDAVGGVPVVELSVIERDYFAAKDRRDGLADYLHAQSWLEPNDALKTQLVLNRYALARN